MNWMERMVEDKREAQRFLDIRASELDLTPDQLVDVLIQKMKERRNG